MRWLLVSIAGLLAAVAASAQPGPGDGVPPAFKLVRDVKKEMGTIFIQETVARMVPQVRAKIVEVDGEKKQVPYTTYATVYEQRIVVLDISQSRVITRDGKQLPIEEVWNRVKKDTVVVVAGDHRTPAPAYLQALSADTPVIILAPPAAPK